MKIKKRHLFVSFLFYIKEWYVIMISIFKRLKKNILNNVYTLKDIKIQWLNMKQELQIINFMLILI